MRSINTVHVVSCHAEGEVGDVIVGGVLPPPGETVWEQSRFIERDETLRNFVLNEPRGGVFRHVNLLVPAKHPDADVGWIIMEPEDTPPMSGSNSMCVSTVLVDTGMVAMVEPVTELVLEAPGGLVKASVHCSNGKAQKVEITNVPCFADHLDATIEVEGVGTMTVDTAYGGDSFVLVDSEALGFGLHPDEARDIAEMGMKITAAANEQLGFVHPENPQWAHISFCQMTAPIEHTEEGLLGRNTVTINPGKLDRSPCGTGCCARMSVLHAKGQLKVGEAFIGRSIIGSQFDCKIISQAVVGDKVGIIPSIAGRAWITGTHQHLLDPDDPWPGGYRLGDTWSML